LPKFMEYGNTHVEEAVIKGIGKNDRLFGDKE
jgi:hypothetical protein